MFLAITQASAASFGWKRSQMKFHLALRECRSFRELKYFLRLIFPYLTVWARWFFRSFGPPTIFALSLTFSLFYKLFFFQPKEAALTQAFGYALRPWLY